MRHVICLKKVTLKKTVQIDVFELGIEQKSTDHKDHKTVSLDFREVDQNSESATDQPPVFWSANLIADALGHLSHKVVLKITEQVAFWKLS